LGGDTTPRARIFSYLFARVATRVSTSSSVRVGRTVPPQQLLFYKHSAGLSFLYSKKMWGPRCSLPQKVVSLSPSVHTPYDGRPLLLSSNIETAPPPRGKKFFRPPPKKISPREKAAFRAVPVPQKNLG